MRSISLILILFLPGLPGILFSQSAQPDSLNPLTVLMQQQLNLTEEQIARVESVNVKSATQRIQIQQLSGRWEKFRKSKALSKARDQEMQAILTVEQFQNYLALKDNLKEKLKIHGGGACLAAPNAAIGESEWQIHAKSGCNPGNCRILHASS